MAMASCRESEVKETNSNINIFRILTTSILLAVTAVGAVGSYLILTNIETATTERQFASYSDQLRSEMLKSVDRRSHVSTTLSKIYANHCPTDDDWPNCYLDFDYMESVGIDLMKSANIPGFAFSTLISSEEQQEYENHMYKVLRKYNVRNSSFGWGVFGLSPDAGSPDLRFKIVNGSFGLQMLAPLIQVSNFTVTGPQIAMFDEYSEYSRFLALNEMRNCTQEKVSKVEPCNILSDIITFPESLTQPVSEISPKSLIFTSVQPSHSNSSKARGAIIVGMEWDTVLSNIIPNDIAGIECVVGINHREFTFKIKKSIGVYSNFVVRKTKLDKSACKEHDNCVSLNVFDGDSTYFMWVRKTREFDAQYETAGPVIAAVIFSIMILLLSAILFAYDMFVNKEILQKEIILRTKQLFVRYISHEIRTPINTIHIGLSLLMAEVNELLKTRQRSTRGELLHRSASADAKRIVPEDGADSLEEKLSHWKDMLVDIEMSSAAAIQVLNDLLDYEQIQISRLNMDMSVVSMWTLCESVFWSFRFNLEAKKIKYQLTMELEADSGAPSLSAQGSAAADHQDYLKHMVVFGDPKKLEQVMRNLISNAIKFTHPDGTVTVDVVFVPGVPQHTSDDISSASSNSTVKVLPVKARQGTMKMSVRDSGEGLSTEQQQTLFTAEGVQFNPNRLQDGKGSGLGLWISKGIIKEHKGSIEVTSPGLGQGSTFTVHIPCRYDESFRFVPFEKPKDNSSSMEMSVSLRREMVVRRILLVDDSVPNVKVCRRLLTNAGYEVDVAYNGEECLTRLETENYHLIIIDNHMPVMDGPTAVKIMRSKGYNLPVVGLTGSITPDELRDFREAGCDDVLCKPLRIQKLIDILSLVQRRNSIPDVHSTDSKPTCGVKYDVGASSLV